MIQNEWNDFSRTDRLVKRPKISNPTRVTNSLHDITNNRYVYNSLNKKNFLNKSAVTEIARKKREQIEALKNSKNLQSSISGIDRRIDKLHNRKIPEIIYNISKRETMIRKTTKQLQNYNIVLGNSDNDIQKLEEKFNLEYNDLIIQFENEVNSIELQFAKNLKQLSNEKEKQIEELEKIKPKDELLKEIDQFNNALVSLDEKLHTLKISNEMFITEYDEKLDRNFQLIRKEKVTSIEKLRREIKEKQYKKQNLYDMIQTAEYNITLLKEDIKSINDQNLILQDNINNIERSSTLPEQKLKSLVNKLHEASQEYDVVLEMKKLEEENLSVYLMRLKEEAEGRKLLQNSIDELKGHIRSFGYKYNDSDPSAQKENLLVFDFDNDTISDFASEENKLFSFNKLFSSSDLTIECLLDEEFKIYNNMCLKDGDNFNLFTISSKPLHMFQDKVLKYISGNYLDKYEVKFQNLSLYDEKYGLDSPFKISEDNLISLDRTPITLTNVPYTIDESRYDELTQIKILKVQFQEKDCSTKSIDFYLIQIDNLNTLNLLYDFFKKKRLWNESQIGLFILKLLNYTKSCFLFNFDTEDENHRNRTMLNISEIISKIRNPPKINN